MGVALKRRPTIQAEFAANSKGAMLAVTIPNNVAARIAIPGGEPPEDLHVTLFYFYDNADLNDDQRTIIRRLASSLAAEYEEFEIRLAGTDVFEENDERPLFAVVVSPSLEEYRRRLAVALDLANITYSKEHEYQPHLTLKYLNSEARPSLTVNELFTVNNLDAWFAGKRIPIPFGNRFIRNVPRGKRHFVARPKAGQKQRIGSGDYETKTNRQQRKLVAVYDKWAAAVKRDLARLTKEGKPLPELQAYLDAQIPKLEARLVEIQSAGIKSAAKTAAGSRYELPAVLVTTDRQIRDNVELIRKNLVPRIHEKLTLALALALPLAVGGIGGLAVEQQKSVALAIKNATLAGRSMPAQYAGGYWVAIFETEKTLGGVREDERASQGLPPEPVRWVLDPRAVHCHASPGFYGCAELAGEYKDGWRSLPTVPAGQVTCRGNCRCHIEVNRDGQWRRGVYDD